MFLDFFKGNKINQTNTKEKLETFANELENKLKTNENRIENCLYQVVDFSEKGVFLQNKNTKVIFEETELSQKLKSTIGVDFILRYKNGEYHLEEDLTDEIMK